MGYMTTSWYLVRDIYMESRDLCGSVQHQFENLWKANVVFFQCRGENCNWQHFPKLLGSTVQSTWH